MLTRNLLTRTFFIPSLIFYSTLMSFLFTIETYQNITLGSSLTAGDDSSSWASPSQDFAFGFQKVQQGNFLLSIWFNKISDITITWSANRDHLVPKGSKVELTSDQGLVLAEPSGLQVWNTSGLGDQLSYAAMLDTGNFVLATQTCKVIWQSFDEPTDTLLPSQVLNLGARLMASYSSTNYSSGRFMMQLSKDGNLSFYTTNLQTYDTESTLYLSPSSQGSGYQVRFNQTGSLHLVAKNGSTVDTLIDDNVVSGQDLYQRAILEYDGVLRHYVYPKKQSSVSGGWSLRSYKPDDICSTAVIQAIGSGLCGFNSYCQLGNDTKTHCYCPPGYTSIDPKNPFSSCAENFTAQSCQDKSDANHFYFETLINVDWPLLDYESFHNVSKDWCRDICLPDCFCAVSIYRSEDGSCWKKRQPLSNGINNSLVGRTAFVKVRMNNTSLINKPHHKSRHHTPILVVAIIITSLIVCLAVYVLRKRKNRKFEHEAKSIGSCLVFSFNTIKAAANDFSHSNKLGKGGFGAVYKGTLANGWEIAVKRLLHHSARGDLEFENEVELMARVHHINLIRLIGYSIRNQERLLIYELAVNGSLDRFLFDSSDTHLGSNGNNLSVTHRDEIKRKLLSWDIRYNIIKGIARGMVYLHEDSELKILHRDLKASNILLDESMTPKISDFGTARLFVEDDQRSASKVVGTFGYMPPEYVKYGKISVKIDVFSFGVLLLEILAGKRNSFPTESQQHFDHLPSKAWKYWKEGKVNVVIDPILLNGANGEIEEIKRCVHIGLLCVQQDDACRPNMNLASSMLEGLSLSLPPPLKPAYFVDHLHHHHNISSLSSLASLSLISITNSIDEPR